MNPTTASLTALVAALRARQLRSRALVDAHIARIQAVNPAINALVADRFAAARAEADAADARLDAAGKDEVLPPLLGLPCTVKEFLDVAGLPSTGGLARQRHRVPTTDATLVQRLKAAGAIVLGVSNAPEGGLWMETYNRIYGWTNNPWKLDHTPGGSSGGEAALVASGASPLGIGSDVGGSVRIPAACCGVVGHKPTGGLWSNAGHHSPPHGETGRYLCSGPLVRRVGDVMPVLRALAGPDPADDATCAWPLGDPAAVDPKQITAWILPDYPLAKPEAAVVVAQERALNALRAAGVTVKVLDEPEVRRSFLMWSTMLSAGFEGSYKAVLAAGTPMSYRREWARLLLRRSDFTFPGLALSMLSDLLSQLPNKIDEEVARGHALRDRLEARLGDHGVLVGPTFPVAAPKHRGLLARPLSHSTTCLWNVMTFPATSVPAGFDARGLPVGMQVVGARGQDHLCLAIAGLIEADSGGWTVANPKA